MSKYNFVKHDPVLRIKRWTPQQTDEWFIRIFMEAYKERLTLAELAQKLHTDKATIIQRATKLRRRGVKLPRFRHYLGTPTETLNRLIADMGSKQTKVQAKTKPRRELAR